VRQEPARHRGWLWRRPTFGGVVVAVLFWWWSLHPSMLPRAWSAQAAVSGLSAAIGYLLGTLAGYGVAALLRRSGRTPSPRVRRSGWLALGVVAAVVVAGLALWPGWQNQQRDLVGMEHVGPAVLAPMVAATLVVFGVLFLVGRVVGHGILLLDRLLARRLPRLVAHLITAALFLAAAVVATRDVVADGFFDWANRRFAAADTTTDPGVTAPTSPAVSGGPASLVPWATLGEYGAASLPRRPARPGCAPSRDRRTTSWNRSGSMSGCARPARPTSGPRSPGGSWSGPAPSGGRC
jgi:uncharacterized membrane protein